jgi:predicted N-acyltransferase
MTYSARRFASIQEIPATEWNSVHDPYGDAFLDLRFLEIVQATLGSQIRFTPVIIADQCQRPAAIFCLSTCRLDATTLGGTWVRRPTRAVRSLWPSFLQLTCVLSGLPITIPHRKICLRPDADPAEIARLWDETAATFARQHHATAVLLGDFSAQEAEIFDRLTASGYYRSPSAPMHYLPLRHRNIPEYLTAMRAEYRRQVHRDLVKSDTQRVQIETIDTAAGVKDPVRPEFYDLYLRLLERVDSHLITLPREFFNQLICLFGENAHLLLARVDGRPAGVAVGLITGSTYTFVLLAVDAELNRQYGIYPRLFLDRIGFAMSLGLEQVNLGTTADEFKLRLGSSPKPRSVYVKVPGTLRYGFAWTSHLWLRAQPELQPRRVFRSVPASSAAAEATAPLPPSAVTTDLAE